MSKRRHVITIEKLPAHPVGGNRWATCSCGASASNPCDQYSASMFKSEHKRAVAREEAAHRPRAEEPEPELPHWDDDGLEGKVCGYCGHDDHDWTRCPSYPLIRAEDLR